MLELDITFMVNGGKYNMGILVKNAKLENGIITDLYYRMPYYKANDKGFQCVCRVYSSLENRKQGEGVVYPKHYVNIENPKEVDTTKMNAKEMYNYVYSLLTEKLGGTAELEYSAEKAAQAAVQVQNEES